MTHLVDGDIVSVAQAALVLRLNREQIIRRIQRGRIAGGKALGVWYVQRSALTEASTARSRDGKLRRQLDSDS